ncbi:MAG: hypothetical protein RL213_247 [Bacteroidota bacterium]
MNILCITSRVPWPLEKGDKLRIYHQLRELSAHHTVHLFAISDGPVHPVALEELRRFCASVEVHRHTVLRRVLNLLRSFPDRLPFQVGYFTSRSAMRKLRTYADTVRPDVMYCQLIRTAEYRKMMPEVPAVLDYMDVFSKGVERRLPNLPFWKRGIFGIEWKRLLRYEASVFLRFVGHTVISEQDRRLLPLVSGSEVAVVPNGVDTGFFRPLQREKDFELLFNGNMNYPPNIESAVFLAREVLPLVHRRRPDVRLLVSGADPAPAVRALASQHVTVTGWVEDVRDSFARCRILAAPMTLSIGLQNKLLEAMAMKLPCITTPLSNNALGGRDGEELLLATTAQEFADQILLLLEDPALAERITENAYRMVKEKYGWEGSVKKLERVLESAFSSSMTRSIR